MRTETEQPDQSSSRSAVDHVEARLLLVVGRDRVLEVEHHDVGAQVRRLLEHARLLPGTAELAAVQARRSASWRRSRAAPPRLQRKPNSEIRHGPIRRSIHRASPDGSPKILGCDSTWPRARFADEARFRLLDPPARLLCGPGPTNVEPPCSMRCAGRCSATSTPTCHAVLDEVVAMLRARLADAGRRRAAAPAPAPPAMETGIANLLEPGRHRDRRRGGVLRPPARRDRRAPRRQRRRA